MQNILTSDGISASDRLDKKVAEGFRMATPFGEDQFANQ